MPKEKRQNLENSSNWRVVAVAEPRPLTPDWMLYQFLKPWTPKDIETAIRRKVTVDFSNLRNYIVNLATEKILEWFRTYRPDLAEILETEDGIEWLRMNVEKAIRS